MSEFTRRDLALVAILPGLNVVRNVVLPFVSPIDQEISHAAESIHQEVVFQASRERVYESLTNPAQFTKVTSFSSVKNAPAAEISGEVGGAFTIFGGHIVGRHVELVPNQRIVEAWRVVTWDPGVYSIAKFELKEQASATMLVFDHTGFPPGKAEHLADGWKTNYWEPMRKYLSTIATNVGVTVP